MTRRLSKYLTPLRCGLFLLTNLLCSCSQTGFDQQKIVEKISNQAPHPINFKDIANSQWSRVCFFGPYTVKSSDVLGFEWEVGEKTNVTTDDTINVIVFATENEVTEYAVIPRDKADFWKLSRQCFPRNDSKLIYQVSVHSYMIQDSRSDL